MRWLQPDTVIPEPYNPQSWNRYSYTLNNPIRYTDPSGHASVGDTNETGCSGKGPACIMDMYGRAGDEHGMDQSLEAFIRRHPKYNPAADPELEGIDGFVVAAAYSRVGCAGGNWGDCAALGTMALLSSPGLVPPAPTYSTDGDFYYTSVSCKGVYCTNGISDSPQDILMPGGQLVGKPSDPGVQEVQSEAEIQEIFDALTADATPSTKPNYEGKGYDLPGGGFVGLRDSKKYGPTIDINIPGIPIDKIHLPK